MDCFVFYKRQLQNYKVNDKTCLWLWWLSQGFFPVPQRDIQWILESVRHSRHVCWMGINANCQLSATILLEIRKVKSVYHMMEMADSVCVTDFGRKGLKPRLLSWLIFAQLLRSFTSQHITPLQNWTVFSHRKPLSVKESISKGVFHTRNNAPVFWVCVNNRLLVHPLWTTL